MDILHQDETMPPESYIPKVDKKSVVKGPIEHIMTKKDISVHYLYEHHEFKDQSRPKEGNVWLCITLEKNKKIDPNIIYDIYKANKYQNLLNEEGFRGNVHSKLDNSFHKFIYGTIHHPLIDRGICLNLCGSRTGKYDYSLDDLPADLPITHLIVNFSNYKYNFNKLPDSIDKITFLMNNYSGYLNYIPKSLKTIITHCNINLENICLIPHDKDVQIYIECYKFNSINYLPQYITTIVTTQSIPNIYNLTSNLQILKVSSSTIDIDDMPFSLKKLIISKNHKDFNKIIEQLTYEQRVHIIKTFLYI